MALPAGGVLVLPSTVSRRCFVSWGKSCKRRLSERRGMAASAGGGFCWPRLSLRLWGAWSRGLAFSDLSVGAFGLPLYLAWDPWEAVPSSQGYLWEATLHKIRKNII